MMRDPHAAGDYLDELLKDRSPGLGDTDDGISQVYGFDYAMPKSGWAPVKKYDVEAKIAEILDAIP